jgi:hypothetical protein
MDLGPGCRMAWPFVSVLARALKGQHGSGAWLSHGVAICLAADKRFEGAAWICGSGMLPIGMQDVQPVLRGQGLTCRACNGSGDTVQS